MRPTCCPPNPKRARYLGPAPGGAPGQGGAAPPLPPQPPGPRAPQTQQPFLASAAPGRCALERRLSGGTGDVRPRPEASPPLPPATDGALPPTRAVSVQQGAGDPESRGWRHSGSGDWTLSGPAGDTHLAQRVQLRPGEGSRGASAETALDPESCPPHPAPRGPPESCLLSGSRRAACKVPLWGFGKKTDRSPAPGPPGPASWRRRFAPRHATPRRPPVVPPRPRRFCPSLGRPGCRLCVM